MGGVVNGLNSVLIVDDEMELLHMLKDGLSLRGYHCETADNAKSAIELLHEKLVDLIIIDIDLPDMNGFELTKKVKKLNPNMAVIIMTGFIGDFSYDDAIQTGATDFIKKPFTVKELVVRIKQIEAQEELKNKVRELEEFYEMAVGRELRMIELKKEIERAKKELEKYKNL
jgi:DNA-binding NtrC family response regulator